MNRNSCWMSLAAVAIAVSVFCVPARSVAGSLQDEVSRQVSIIKSSLNGATDIDLRNFDGLSSEEFNGHIGPGIREAFGTSLAAAGISLNPRAEHVLKGEYFVTDRKSLQAGKPLRLTIKLGLTKRSGDIPVDLLPIRAELDAAHFATVDSTKDLAKALGLLGRLTPDPSEAEQVSKEQRQSELKEFALDPVPLISGTRLRASAGSEYELEIMAKPLGSPASFHPCKPYLDGALVYTDIARNEMYEIKLNNYSQREVAAAVTVDGIDVFYFADKKHRDKEGHCLYSHFIVPAAGASKSARPSYGTTMIVGWFQKLDPPNNYLSFLVTEYGGGAASRAGLKASDQVGAIHVQFSHCRPLAEGEYARSGDETGFGPPRSVQQKAVRYEIKPPHEFITIRYTRPQR